MCCWVAGTQRRPDPIVPRSRCRSACCSRRHGLPSGAPREPECRRDQRPCPPITYVAETEEKAKAKRGPKMGWVCVLVPPRFLFSRRRLIPFHTLTQADEQHRPWPDQPPRHGNQVRTPPSYRRPLLAGSRARHVVLCGGLQPGSRGEFDRPSPSTGAGVETCQRSRKPSAGPGRQERPRRAKEEDVCLSVYERHRVPVEEERKHLRAGEV